MDDKLVGTADKLLIEALDAVTTAKDFMAAEVPEIVEQLLVWHFVENLAYAILGVLVFVVLGLCIRRITLGVRLDKEGDSGVDMGHNEGDIVSYIAVPAIVGFTALLVGPHIFNLIWLKIWIAPKLYLLEYAADLVR